MIIYLCYLFLSILIDYLSKQYNIYDLIFIRHFFIFVCLSIYNKKIYIQYSFNTLIRSLVIFYGFFFYLKVLQTSSVYNTTLSYYLIPIFDICISTIKKVERHSPFSLMIYIPLLLHIRIINLYAICGALCFSYSNILIKKEDMYNLSYAFIIAIISVFFLSTLNLKLLFIGILSAILNYFLIILIKNNSFEQYHGYQFLDVIILSFISKQFTFLFYFACIYIFIHHIKKIIKLS